jgi:hypothetical protein
MLDPKMIFVENLSFNWGINPGKSSKFEKYEAQFRTELQDIEKQLYDIFIYLRNEWGDSTDDSFVDAFSDNCGVRPLRHLLIDCEDILQRAFENHCQLDSHGHKTIKELLHVKPSSPFNVKMIKRPTSLSDVLDSFNFKRCFKLYDESFVYDHEVMACFQKKYVRMLDQIEIFKRDFDQIKCRAMQLRSVSSADGYLPSVSLASRLNEVESLSCFFAEHFYMELYLNDSHWCKGGTASNYVLFVIFYVNLYQRLMGNYVCGNKVRLADLSQDSA